MTAPYDLREQDLETCRYVNGLFVGLLSPDEAEAFDRLCENYLARRAYIGAAGFMGLAKVEIFEQQP